MEEVFETRASSLPVQVGTPLPRVGEAGRGLKGTTTEPGSMILN
ncbi:MAG: hypothetical protein V1733_05495 [bacterium]